MAPIILESVNSTLLNSTLLTNLTQSASLAARAIATGLIKTATEYTGAVATNISTVVLGGGSQAVHVVGGNGGFLVLGAFFPGFFAAYFARRRRRRDTRAAPVVPYGYTQHPYYYATPASPPAAFVVPASPQPAKLRPGPPVAYDPVTGGYYTYGYGAQPQRHVSFGGTQVRRYG